MLKIVNVSKFFGGLEAIKRLSMEIEKGEVRGLIGPNGAGKTTLFNLICGFYRPDAGKIEFKGRDITKLRPDQICKLGIGRCFQIPKPFRSMTVEESLMVAGIFGSKHKKEVGKKIKEILELTELGEKRKQKVSSLTLPDIKLVEIARALMIEPELLLLDEVASGLTPTEINKRIQLIKKISEMGITLFVIEHNMKFIAGLCDIVTVLNFGEKIAEGKMEEVVKNKKVISAYLGEEMYA
jgi:branched-chain amino acid transport system ATP-binding protein